MADVIINDEHLHDIADAIRSKTGSEDMYKPREMAEAIEGIEGRDPDCNGLHIPEEEGLKLTGYCGYMFFRGQWNWFLNSFGDRVTTEDISLATQMFAYSDKLTEIPFNLNITNSCKAMAEIFYECKQLTTIPSIRMKEGQEYIVPTSTYSGHLDISGMFRNCYHLREIPYDFFTSFITEEFKEATMSTGGGDRDKIFGGCYSLRELPDLSTIHGGTASAYSNFYYDGISDCYSLNKVINFPVQRVKYTANMFPNTIATGYGELLRISDFTFEVQSDGSPYTVEWAKQAISFDNGDSWGVAGVVQNISGWSNYILDYNSGITADKEVKTAEDYANLKDDPDWWTRDVAFARYSRDSALRTLQSLPDASEFLVSQSGATNTIKFRGEAGSGYGKAINTLTPEEVAIGTQKGWTISFS